MGQSAQSEAQEWQRLLNLQTVQRQYNKHGKRYLRLITGNGKRELRSVVTLGQTNTLILLGEEKLDGWTTEELMMGRRKDRNGKLRGQHPKVVPKIVHDELVKRTLDAAAEKLRSNLSEAVDVLTEIVGDESVDPKERLKAVSMVMDRVMGKSPDRIKVEGGSRWKNALNASIVATDEDVANAEVDDDEEYEDAADVIEMPKRKPKTPAKNTLQKRLVKNNKNKKAVDTKGKTKPKKRK